MTNLVNNQEFQTQFNEILLAINESKHRVYKNINKELITLYWNIGKYIHEKVESKLWGKSVVENLAEYISQKQPHLKGYSKQNLWRMRQFYDIYKDNEKLSPLVRELSWTHNVIIFSRCKLEEEREFYIRLAIKERLSKRELDRQIDTSTFERVMLSKDGVSSALKTIIADKTDDTLAVFKDTYILDFLDDLPKEHKEKDLQQALIHGLKDFILELGKDFTFVGQNYKLEVGGDDFYIDLLFYHRELACLVCFELKTEKFKPEHLGQLNFYLEALDQDVKKSHENPSIGILLCSEKNIEVVKYALNRSLSPALIADYETKLIPKEILQKKMHELIEEIENKEE